MVEAFSSTGDYLGKLTSTDGLTWQLEGLEESELVLQMTVKPGSSSRRLRGVTLNGWDVQQCGADRRQAKPKRRKGPGCLKVSTEPRVASHLSSGGQGRVREQHSDRR